MRPGIRLEGGIGGGPTPGWWCVQRACTVPCLYSQHSAFVPGSSEFAVRFFGLLVSFVHNLPQLYMHAIIFSPF